MKEMILAATLQMLDCVKPRGSSKPKGCGKGILAECARSKGLTFREVVY